MTRSKRSSKNSARAALNKFILAAFLFSLCGCFFAPGKPTYNTQNVAKALQDLALKEYKTEISVRLVGSTLWIYMPVTDLFIPNPNKNEKYPEKFQVVKNSEDKSITFKGSGFDGDYNIKAAPIKDKSQDWKINKEMTEKIGNLWKLVRRVLFGFVPSEREGVKFVSMVIGDIKNGFEVKEIFYVRDLKKVSYGLMSIWEFQHRVIQDSSVSPLVIGDKAGRHIEYTDITLKEFVRKQIEYRISLKFHKPEVEQNADIDREIAKIVTETLQMYELKDVGEVRLRNLGLNTNTTLSGHEIWGSPKTKK